MFGVEGGSIAAGKHVSSPIPSICWGDSGGGFYEPVGAGENRAVARVFGLVSWEPEPSRCTDRTTDEQFFTNLAGKRRLPVPPPLCNLKMKGRLEDEHTRPTEDDFVIHGPARFVRSL